MTALYRLTGDAHKRAARKRPHQPETYGNNIFALVVAFNKGFFTNEMALEILKTESLDPAIAFTQLISMGYVIFVGDTYHTIRG